MNNYMSWLIIIAYSVSGNDGRLFKTFNMASFTRAEDYLKPIAIIKNTHIPLHLFKLIHHSKNMNNPGVPSKNYKHKVVDIRRNDNIDLKALSPNQRHKYKVKQVADFILRNRLTANYLYEEMKRIKRQHQVKDDLRKMVTILEQIPSLKAEVLKNFDILLQKLEPVSDFWSHKTNQLTAKLVDF